MDPIEQEVTRMRNREITRARRDFDTLKEIYGFVDMGLLQRLTMWFPNSANVNDPNLALNNANQFPAHLQGLMQDLGVVAAPAQNPTCESWGGGVNQTAQPLGALFQKYGSDKSTIHNYHHLYATLLEKLGLDAPLNLLEVGLGTNNPKLVSSMGVGGKPGASLRAFRDFLPQAQVYGADVDAQILFQETRIRTAHVDQLKPQSLAALPDHLGCKQFDLIIDDGLHAVDANINTLRFALTAVKPGGFVVIEDIPERSAQAWLLIEGLMAQTAHHAHFVRGARSHLFVVEAAA
ncbi:class I SAM-dependent methyltransferase [Magnetococcus sp. PR-3]|uniref:class I SAM-dependent methyltransferase n=1 Tax=Magnetococcus sp. PR-3 TaxID=3120355 RepID=UPI002FCE6742